MNSLEDQRVVQPRVSLQDVPTTRVDHLKLRHVHNLYELQVTRKKYYVSQNANPHIVWLIVLGHLVHRVPFFAWRKLNPHFPTEAVVTLM